MIDWLLTEVTRTITVVEVVWVTLTGLGVALHLYAVWDTSRTVHALHVENENGRLAYAAKADVIEEAVRIFKQGLLMMAGVVSMTRPMSANARPASIAAIILLLLGAVGLMIGVTMYKLRARRRIRAYNRGVTVMDVAYDEEA